MPSCEKCWSDAGGDALRYYELLAERADEPCTPEQQAGQWWDAERKVDTRIESAHFRVSREHHD